jgi:lathosterol oxidase
VSSAPSLPLLIAFLLAMHLGRYLLFAGGAWLAFWAWANPFTARRRLQHLAFTRADLTRELGFSALTTVVFAVTFAFLFGATPVPLRSAGAARAVELLGWLSFLVLVHDTYFYWSHRLLHHPRVFPVVHALHHRSRNPSPFAALAFHPLEALAQAAWAAPLAWLLPIPTASWLAFAFLTMLVNVMGHCGVEPYPASWRRHPVLKWLNFATFHNGHHLQVTANYGLYFSAWDRWMGTLQADDGETRT